MPLKAVASSYSKVYNKPVISLINSSYVPGKSPAVGEDLIAAANHDPLHRLSSGLRPVISKILDGLPLSEGEAMCFADSSITELGNLCNVASLIRDRGKGRIVGFSPKIFIPLTRLCRDFCGYCTFRQAPSQAKQLYMTPAEVLDLAKAGEKLGCTEALFTLGEHPEQRYPEARSWLKSHGFRTTIEYLHHMCTLVVRETSLLPHGNPGTMSRREMISLKEVNASMGVMLEVLSQRICERGGAHNRAPSKWPLARMKTLETAGQLKIPFTTGILIGIGENRQERILSLRAIGELHRRYGHIQEIIIQNFRAKPKTAMAHHPNAPMTDLLWTVAVARLLLGPSANIQVPPNLSANDYPDLLMAGINDWGGVSPLTIDHVNPEAPWPRLSELERRTNEKGFTLRPRLPVYPQYILGMTDYMPHHLKEKAKSLVDENGYVKGGINRYVATTA